MPNNKFITNPEAIEFIENVKSGKVWQPIKAWLSRYKWFLIGGLVLVLLLLGISIGKKLSQQATPVYVPPVLEVTNPSVTPQQKKSVFSGIKQKIIDLNLQLPDPAIPSFDNHIDLEQ